MTVRRNGSWLSAVVLMGALLAAGAVARVAGDVSEGVSPAIEPGDITIVDRNVPTADALDRGRGIVPRPHGEPVSWRERDNPAVGIASTQDWSCDNNWDCGSALACDPYSYCSVDLYACVVSQKTGRGQCVHRGFCGPCQPLPPWFDER